MFSRRDGLVARGQQLQRVRGMSRRVILLGVVFAALLATHAAGEGEAPAGGEAEGEKLPMKVQLAMAVVLVCLSAMFAGMTLGIMGLDTLSLEIIDQKGRKPPLCTGLCAIQ